MNETRLVAAEVGHDELGVVRVEPLQVVLEGREAKEPVLLALALERDLVDRAGVAGAELALRVEARAARAVPALVGALVDVPVVVNALHDLRHTLCVALVRRADEEVVGRVHRLRHRLELGRVAVGEHLRVDPLALGGQLDRFAVLVGAGQEEHVLVPLAHVPGEDVRGDHRVRVPQMGLRVHVEDRRCDVEGHGTREDMRPAQRPRKRAPYRCSFLGWGYSWPCGGRRGGMPAASASAASTSRRIARSEREATSGSEIPSTCT